MTKITGDIRREHSKIFSKYFNDISYSFAHNQGGRSNKYVEQFSPRIINKEIKDIKPCAILWSEWHLTCEGYLTACCVDYENDLVFADLNKESPSEAWNNKIIRDLRSRHINKNLKGTICYNCLTGEEDSYLPISDLAKNNNSCNSSNKKLEAYLDRIKKI